MTDIKTTLQNKKVWFIIVLVLVLAGASTALFLRQKSSNSSKTSGGTDAAADSINFDPPTEQEQRETEEHKEDLEQRIDQEQNPTPPPAGTKQVAPTISSWGQNPSNSNVEIAAFIDGIYEDGGTCTLTMTKGAKTITKSAGAHKDVNRTSCDLMVVPQPELEPGDWVAAITYASSTAKGVSAKQTVTVK